MSRIPDPSLKMHFLGFFLKFSLQISWVSQLPSMFLIGLWVGKCTYCAELPPCGGKCPYLCGSLPMVTSLGCPMCSLTRLKLASSMHTSFSYIAHASFNPEIKSHFGLSSPPFFVINYFLGPKPSINLTLHYLHLYPLVEALRLCPLNYWSALTPLNL